MSKTITVNKSAGTTKVDDVVTTSKTTNTVEYLATLATEKKELDAEIIALDANLDKITDEINDKKTKKQARVTEINAEITEINNQLK